jgi:phage gp36-like protein
MATTIQVDSFPPSIIRERTQLSGAAVLGDTTLNVMDSAGFAADDIIYVGILGRETCEKAVVASVDSETTITLSSPLGLAHEASEPVTKVMGSQIKIYRAPNVDGTVPAAEQFTVLATREIDADNTSTYYRDSSGSSAYWYCFTNFNETTLEETDRSTPIRGDDFGHYASITEIKSEAGFANNLNLMDSTVDQQRRAAESEINASLSGSYTVPFDPIPDIIHTLTIQLGAALLRLQAYGETADTKQRLADVRAKIQLYSDGDLTLIGEDGSSLGDSDLVSGYPDSDCPPRMFSVGDIF